MAKYRAIIIGATSGIGHEVAHSLARQGVILGIAGRRIERLDALVEEFGAERIYCAKMDVREDSATEALDELIAKVGAPDLLLYASGIGKQNPELDEEIECQTVLTNSLGMVRIIDHFLNYVKREERYNAKHKAHIAKKATKDGLAEDAQKDAENELQKIHDKMIKKVDDLLAEKNKEIMTV